MAAVTGGRRGRKILKQPRRSSEFGGACREHRANSVQQAEFIRTRPSPAAPDKRKPRKRARPPRAGAPSRSMRAKRRTKLADRHLRLHARERHAGAGVDAGAEGQMPVGLTAQSRAARDRGIARDRDWRRRCRYGHRCRPASRRRRAPCPWRRGGCRAGSSFPCAGIPRPRSRSASGSARSSRKRLGMADQQIDAVADQVGRRLVPGVEQEDAVVQQLELAEPLAVGALRLEVAGVDQRREDFAGSSPCLPRRAAR